MPVTHWPPTRGVFVTWGTTELPQLTVPAMVFLETFRPLNYLGAQAMYFLQPIATVILDGDGYRCFTEFLEQRGSVDYMSERIQEMEASSTRDKNPQDKVASRDAAE